MCADCGEWKDATQFYKAKKGGLWSYCKSCFSVRNRIKYEKQLATPHLKEAATASTRLSKELLKQQVIAAYGGACACCGEAEPQFLTLDHVNNDGAEHRRTSGLRTGIATWRYARRMGYPDTFQLLCWNCNGAKGAYGRCPHERAKLEVVA